MKTIIPLATRTGTATAPKIKATMAAVVLRKRIFGEVTAGILVRIV